MNRQTAASMGDVHHGDPLVVVLGTGAAWGDLMSIEGGVPGQEVVSGEGGSLMY